MTVTPPEHANGAAVEEAAAFLRALPSEQRLKPLVTEVKKRFNLMTHEAVDAIHSSEGRRR